jgi:PKD repeat protein
LGLTDITAIAGGYGHSLALKSDGTVWAWGSNWSGQLGNGTEPWNSSNIPVPVLGLTGITAIAGGADHSLALKSDGSVWAWGENGQGQLGDGTRNNSNVPVQIASAPGTVFTQIAAGEIHSVALAALPPMMAAAATTDPVSGLAPMTVHFTGLASGGDGGPYSYDWNFGDGSPRSPIPNPTHTYNIGGTFRVTLTVTDGLGTTGTDTHLSIQVTQRAAPVVLNFFDDAARARLCLNRLTGDYTWTVYPGTPSEANFSGVATIINGGTKAYSKPGDSAYLNSTYDAARHRATAYFSAPGVYSTLYDMNTANNPPGCY